MSSKARLSNAPSIPHSWCVKNWPPGVYPGNSSRARNVLRSYRNDLVAEGALTRLGRDLIVIGNGYARFLTKRAARVLEFESNNPAMRKPAEPLTDR
jgi:hypothetical protein